MKKLLIATTALVATAGMASADITITGHAAAGVYSSLSNKDGHGKITAAAATKTKGGFTYIDVSASSSRVITIADGSGEVALGAGDIVLAGTNGQDAQAADVGTYSGDGIYSNAGVDFTMTGATDNGISFSASVNIDAGMEIDAGDFELDGKDGGTAGLGSVSMSGAFGTLTFDDGGIENLYSDALTNADVTYATTVGAVSLTVAHDTAAASGSANSVSAGYSASGMDFTFTASEAAGGTSNSLAVSYALNDTVTLTGETDQAATKESVQTIGASTTLNGVSVAVSSANNSTWDVDLGYTAGGFALTYGVDETDGWTATATAALGGGATFAAGVNNEDSMYAGVSFAF
ncbi:porin [Amylibacter sp.]|nr:porin [Amylibacter sp.]